MTRGGGTRVGAGPTGRAGTGETGEAPAWRVRRWLRYAWVASLVTLAVVGVVWPFLPEEGRHGLLLAAAVALPAQLLAFAGLMTQKKGSPGFLAAWVGGTFVRLLVLAAVALWVARREEVDTATALLALVGLLFILLLLEPWAARERRSDTDRNESDTDRNETEPE
jgi:hypothetical protein